jgi:hypothetical protein
LLQSCRIKVARALPDAALLVKELENFKLKVTESAKETFEAWREGDHDDLVMACATAAWEAERARGFNVWVGGVIETNTWRAGWR